MASKVSLAEVFGRFDEAWSPKIAGSVNDMHVRLAKFRGAFIWHFHEREDELFLVHKGRLLMRFRDREIHLGPGEFIIVPKGVEHMPAAESDECEILTLSPSTLLNTGNVENERTVRELGRLGSSK